MKSQSEFFDEDDAPSEQEQFIEDILREQEYRFCTFSHLQILVTTFNVNGRLPSPPEDLKDWLTYDTSNMPNLIAIGLQEMDLNLGTYVTDNDIKQQRWLFFLKRYLPDIYEMVECIRLIGIFLVLYKKTGSNFKIHNVHGAFVPTGFLKFGNKGGVGISLMLNDTALCFVNSHLAAGSSELYRRNQDFRDISQIQFSNSRGLYDHDVIIWMGDLNYRLTTLSSFEEVVHTCVSGNHASLFKHDQLREQQKENMAFHKFIEKTPQFPPTYKYDVNTNNWDTSEKRRVPAWCDRILYHQTNKNVHIEQLSYNSSGSVLFSDHKPVHSVFRLTIKQVDIGKKKEVLKEMDQKINDLLPQVTLSQTEFDLGIIEFNTPAVAMLTIKNTGATSTHFKFPKIFQDLKDKNIDENWITMTPKSSLIELGGDVLVTLQACVKNEEALMITNLTPIECILVLSLYGGRHHFITVNAKYAPPAITSNIRPNSTKPDEDSETWIINFDDVPGNSTK